MLVVLLDAAAVGAQATGTGQHSLANRSSTPCLPGDGPFALLLGVGPLARGRHRPRKIRDLSIIAFISTLVLSLLLPWLSESKVAAMTVSAWQWPAGLLCWQRGSCAAYFTWHENHLQLLGNGGG
ncbi:hypothetical protein ACNKHX_13785 [Shigella flexneri]